MARYSNRVKTLRNRADYLRDRIERGNVSPGVLVYFTEELTALDWAIEVLSDMLERDRPDAENVERKRAESKMKSLALKAMWHLKDHEPDRVKNMIENASPTFVAMWERYQEQRRYGANVPRADDTRRGRYEEIRRG